MSSSVSADTTAAPNEAELKNLRDENRKLKKEVKDTQAKLKDSQEHWDKKYTEIEDLYNENRELRKKVEFFKKRGEVTALALQRSQDNWSKRDKELDNARSDLEEKNEQLKDLNLERAEILRDNNRQRKESEKQLSALKDELKKTQDILQKLEGPEGVHGSAVLQLLTTRVELDDKTRELEESEKIIEELIAQVNAYEVKYAKLTQEVNEINAYVMANYRASPVESPSPTSPDVSSLAAELGEGFDDDSDSDYDTESGSRPVSEAEEYVHSGSATMSETAEHMENGSPTIAESEQQINDAPPVTSPSLQSSDDAEPNDEQQVASLVTDVDNENTDDGYAGTDVTDAITSEIPATEQNTPPAEQPTASVEASGTEQNTAPTKQTATSVEETGTVQNTTSTELPATPSETSTIEQNTTSTKQLTTSTTPQSAVSEHIKTDTEQHVTTSDPNHSGTAQPAIETNHVDTADNASLRDDVTTTPGDIQRESGKPRGIVHKLLTQAQGYGLTPPPGNEYELAFKLPAPLYGLPDFRHKRWDPIYDGNLSIMEDHGGIPRDLQDMWSKPADNWIDPTPGVSIDSISRYYPGAAPFSALEAIKMFPKEREERNRLTRENKALIKDKKALENDMALVRESLGSEHAELMARYKRLWCLWTTSTQQLDALQRATAAVAPETNREQEMHRLTVRHAQFDALMAELKALAAARNAPNELVQGPTIEAEPSQPAQVVTVTQPCRRMHVFMWPFVIFLFVFLSYCHYAATAQQDRDLWLAANDGTRLETLRLVHAPLGSTAAALDHRTAMLTMYGTSSELPDVEYVQPWWVAAAQIRRGFWIVLGNIVGAR